MDPLLADRVCIVTGGAGGIGAGVCRRFAEHGALVELVDIDSERAAKTAAAITADGGRVRTHRADVRDPDAVAAFCGDVVSHHGRVDVLVNNVGHYLRPTPFPSSDLEHWRGLHAVNFEHILLVTHAVLPTMVDRGTGVIVNVSSVEGMRGYPADPVYGAYKAAVNQFTVSLAAAMGRKGIRVNGVGPDLTQSLQVDYSTIPPEDQHKWSFWAPLGRHADAGDQADVILFLASDLSRFVTGHVIPTDGGTKAAGGWFFSPTRRRFVNRPDNP